MDGSAYKHKSGQAPETLTKRKAWQVKDFSFLKKHIYVGVSSGKHLQ